LEQGIQSIFAKIGCDKSALSETLGSTGVTESNMMQYLGVIEQRCNELMHSFSNKANQHPEVKAEASRHPTTATHLRGGDVPSVLSVGAGPQAPAGSTVINIEPPAIGDDNNSECFRLSPVAAAFVCSGVVPQVTTSLTMMKRGR
jgi:hypothetical protein